jgi:hypothetical protein
VADQMRPRPAPPIATDARTADGRTVCAICRRPIGAGAREALTAEGWAHLSPCVVSVLGGRP